MNEFIHYYPSGRLLVAILLLIVIDLITGVRLLLISKGEPQKGYAEHFPNLCNTGEALLCR